MYYATTTGNPRILPDKKTHRALSHLNLVEIVGSRIPQALSNIRTTSTYSHDVVICLSTTKLIAAMPIPASRNVPKLRCVLEGILLPWQPRPLASQQGPASWLVLT